MLDLQYLFETNLLFAEFLEVHIMLIVVISQIIYLPTFTESLLVYCQKLGFKTWVRKMYLLKGKIEPYLLTK